MKTRVLMFAMFAVLGGCVPYVVEPYHGRHVEHGPPAHAPAHGYRMNHHNHELMFDNGVGVYIVVGSPGFYFWDDFYWRLRDGIWVRATVFDGPWIVVEDRYRHLPPGLAKKHGYGKGEEKGKGKGKDKDKNHEH